MVPLVICFKNGRDSDGKEGRERKSLLEWDANELLVIADIDRTVGERGSAPHDIATKGIVGRIDDLGAGY